MSRAAAVPGLVALTRQVAARYAGASHYARNFVRGKLLTDPATPAILRLAWDADGFGVVVDLGCGRGQVGLALLTAGLAQAVHGLDLDPGKIADARRACAGFPADFAVADLRQAAIPACDTALVFDVLLQMPEQAQRALIARMAAAARRRIVIRAFDPDCGWRGWLGSTMEEAGRQMRRDGSAFRPLPLAELAAPLPNVMLLAERKAS